MSIINFKVDDDGIVISVSYDASITIKDFIRDYLAKHCNYKSLDPNQYSIYAGSKCLNSPRFLDKQLKDIIKTDSIVTFRRKMELQYCGGIETVDISKNKTKEVSPAKNVPFYRYANKGLNIRATCKNNNCIAYNNVVYIQIGYVQNWNLFVHLEDKVVCPSCKEMVNPENYYFLKCNYKIDYIKNSDGKMKGGSISGSASSDNYKTFDEEESGKAIFAKLVFNVTRL
jgi:hypothetical protein